MDHNAEADRMVAKLTQDRKDKGLRQVDIADAIGVTQPVISEFESGKTSPRLATIMKYAAVIGKRIEVVDSDE